MKQIAEQYGSTFLAALGAVLIISLIVSLLMPGGKLSGIFGEAFINLNLPGDKGGIDTSFYEIQREKPDYAIRTAISAGRAYSLREIFTPKEGTKESDLYVSILSVSYPADCPKTSRTQSPAPTFAENPSLSVIDASTSTPSIDEFSSKTGNRILHTEFLDSLPEGDKKAYGLLDEKGNELLLSSVNTDEENLKVVFSREGYYRVRYTVKNMKTGGEENASCVIHTIAGENNRDNGIVRKKAAA